MVNLGDVFTVIAILFGICFTAWALIMGAALIFQSGAMRAKVSYQTAPWRSFGWGLLASFLLGFLSIALFRVPLPAAKMMGTCLMLTLMALSALGSAGVALLIADRICQLDPGATRYSALLRATTYIAVAGMFPVLGWFLVSPALIVVSAGCAIRSIFAGETVAAPS